MKDKVNHAEAYELAVMKQEESNLAGAYLDLHKALQTAREALEWIANGASHDPQRYAKSAIADLDQPEPAREPREKSLCVKE